MELTDRSLVLFLAYAHDAGNWNGSPLVGGNVPSTAADRGNLTDLKKAGLITTQVDGRDTWLYFTEAGKAHALSHGIDLSWV